MNHLKREQPRMATIRAERVLESRARFDPAFSVLDAPPVAALHALSLWSNWVGPAPSAAAPALRGSAKHPLQECPDLRGYRLGRGCRCRCPRRGAQRTEPGEVPAVTVLLGALAHSADQGG